MRMLERKADRGRVGCGSVRYGDSEAPLFCAPKRCSLHAVHCRTQAYADSEKKMEK